MEWFLTTIFVHSNPVHTKEDKSWENEAKKAYLQMKEFDFEQFLNIQIGGVSKPSCLQLGETSKLWLWYWKSWGENNVQSLLLSYPLVFSLIPFGWYFYWIFSELKVKFSHYLCNLALNIGFIYSTNYLIFLVYRKLGTMPTVSTFSLS